MKHNIVMTCEAKTPDALLLKRQIRKCILAALDEEGVDTPCEINVLVTDDASIRAINKAYRNIDKATDVLSFPMFQLTPGVLPESWDEYKDPETGLVPIWRSLSSGRRSRRRNSAIRRGVRSAISRFTRFYTCLATTMWTRAR